MRIAAIILAAGRSSRFEGANKLLADVRGKPMLVHVLDIVRIAGVSDCLVVTGHNAEAVGRAARELGADGIDNPKFSEGMSTSIRAGIAALPEAVDAAFLMLGDMPLVAPQTLLTLMTSAQAMPDILAFIPEVEGQWGNPVLIRRGLFARLTALSGDHGARKLLASMPERIHLVPVEDAGILVDFDTREALSAVQ